MGLNLRRTLFNPAEPINREALAGAGVAVLALADAALCTSAPQPLLCSDSRHHVLMFHLCPFKEPWAFQDLCAPAVFVQPAPPPRHMEASLATV